MNPVTWWTSGGATLVGAATATLLTYTIIARRLHRQLTAMRNHLASCPQTVTHQKRQTTKPVNVWSGAGVPADSLADLDERRRRIAAANPDIAAVVTGIESSAIQTVLNALTEETEGL